MRITCHSCGKQIDIPDEKVPDRPFSLACPACAERIAVDPTQMAAPAAAPPVPETAGPGAGSPPAAGNAPADEAAPRDSGGGNESLAPLRPSDRKLLADLPALAYVVQLGSTLPPNLDDALRHLGIDEIRHGSDLEATCSEILETGAGVLVVALDKAPPPPCEPLDPVYRLPPDQRRSTFVALVADNVRGLDGQVAFYLQVNCVLNAKEPLASRLRRAVLHHLRLYRHWNEDS
ncbi:MAG: zinc-ribbon domain-containing protein [Acidobacteriota bacterium]